MIDLHTHSSHSDGSDSPEHVVELAAAAGVSVLSLTDHDTTAGLAAATARAADLEITFVPGIELSCHTSDRTVHLLGYGFDPNDLSLGELLRGQISARNERNSQLVERLNDLGYEISMEEVLSFTDGGTVGRPHVARALVERRYVSSIEAAFEELLADDRPAYIDRRELSAVDAITAVHAAGGVTAWAHPARMATSAFDERQLQPALDELIEAGLDAIESWYSTYDPDRRRAMVRLARRNDLLPTGGSDYHGTYKPDLAVGIGRGDLQVPNDVWDELQSRLARLSK
jgi:predicted metal-dependent phosphoesterase TrpH